MPRTSGRRTDANHAAIRESLRKLGAAVEDTHALGGGFPDLVASVGLAVALVEVKDPAKPPSARRLTDDEQAFAAKHPAHIVIQTPDDCARLVNALRRRDFVFRKEQE